MGKHPIQVPLGPDRRLQSPLFTPGGFGLVLFCFRFKISHWCYPHAIHVQPSIVAWHESKRRPRQGKFLPPMPIPGPHLVWSMIRKSGYRFSLATNAKRLRGDHAQTKKIERDDDSKKSHPAPGFLTTAPKAVAEPIHITAGATGLAARRSSHSAAPNART